MINRAGAYLKSLYATILILLISSAAHATHIVGMDLFYTWVSGNTYKITLIVYGDCGSTSAAFGALPSCTPTICIYDGSTSVSNVVLAIQAPAAGVEITPVCPADISLTQCTNISYTIPGIKKFVYSGNYTVPYTSSHWRFIFGGDMGASTLAGRASTITNIGSGSLIQLVDTLNNTSGHNSSPALTVVPTPFFCLSSNDNYNPGAVDADGDSLSFFLVPGVGPSGGGIPAASCEPTGPVSYVFPFTATAPLAATSFSFDSHTGQISFFPNALQRALVVYNIEEHRSGTLVGTSQREMTFLVITCTNTPATANISGVTNGFIDDSTHFHTCENTGPFTISLNPTEPNPANHIWVTSAGLPSGATLTTAGNGTATPHVTFSWTSTGVTPGVYTFYVTYTDDNCPLQGTQTLAYTVTIGTPPAVTFSIISPATCTQKAYVSITPSGPGSPYHVSVSDFPGDTIQNFYGVSSMFHDSLPSGNYTLNVYSSVVSSCGASVTMNIAHPAAITTTGTYTSPTYCGLNNGSIVISGLTPGSTDTVKYYYNGVPATPIVAVASATGTITLSGLTAGTYTSVTVVYGNCLSIPIGPFVLVNPPMPTPTATITNPSYCGHNDGSITLHSLHPTYLDTVRFTFGGVPQPYQLHTVASDSTVIITGLYAGVYNGITVAFGSCNSPAIGPFTLTAPAIPVPTGTSTNPSYCGHADGTITISGLHPGDLDTIKYYYNGILQPPVTYTVSATGTVVLAGLLAGTYTSVYATFANCITNAVGPFFLTNPPIPVPTATFTNPSYCGHTDGSITISNLHPGDIDTIKYYFNGVLQPPHIATVSAAGTVVLTGLGAGIYSSVTATYGPCVTTSLGPYTLSTPALASPTATFTSPTYCGNNDGKIIISNLHSGDADTIMYTFNGVAAAPVHITVSASGTVTLTGLVAGVYSNIYSVFGPCTTSSVGPFTLVDPPFTMRNVTFTNPTKCGFCDGTMTFYGLHPGQTDQIHYTFNGAVQAPVSMTVAADSTLVLNNLCAGAYSDIYVAYNANCVSNTFGTFTLVAPPIVPGFTDVVTNNCKGDTLICNNTSTPASDLTYVWSFGDGLTSTAINPVHVYTASGNYHVVLHITNTRCVDSTFANINLSNLVNAGFIANPDSFLCSGKPVTFTNTSTGVGLNYFWSFGDGNTDTNPNTSHVYAHTGTYTIKLGVSNSVPCTDTARAVISVDSISSIYLTISDTTLCAGQYVTLIGDYSLDGNLGVIWTFGDGDSMRNVNHVMHSFTSPGHMVITVHAIYRACPDTSITKNIWVFPYPSVNIGPDTTLCSGSTALTFYDHINMNNPNARWMWNTGQTTPEITVNSPGTYSVTVKIDGCEATDEVVVNNDCYMSLPNVFTPNGDGVNDYFFPRDLLTRGLISFKMDIYNRWGNEVFSTNSLDGRGWDGKYNGVDQPEGVFVYIIDATFKDGQHEHHQGNLTLLR